MKKLFAEFAGTFLIVLIGTGAIIYCQLENFEHTNLTISIAFGAAVFLAIVLFAKISGAHFNPAVTIALAMSGYWDRSKILPYVLAQLSGALLASLVLRLVFPTHQFLGTTLPSGTAMESFALEFFLTFLLIVPIIYFNKSTKYSLLFIAVFIGLIVGLEAFFAGPICGASMNPARSIGPAIVSLHLEFLWIYVVATTCGGICASILFNIVSRKN